MSGTTLLAQLYQSLAQRVSRHTEGVFPVPVPAIEASAPIAEEYSRFFRRVEIAALGAIVSTDDLLTSIEELPLALREILAKTHIPVLANNALVRSLDKRLSGYYGPADDVGGRRAQAFATYSQFHALATEFESDRDAWLWWERIPRAEQSQRVTGGGLSYLTGTVDSGVPDPEAIRVALSDADPFSEDFRRLRGVWSTAQFLLSLRATLELGEGLPLMKSGMWWYFGRMLNNPTAVAVFLDYLHSFRSVYRNFGDIPGLSGEPIAQLDAVEEWLDKWSMLPYWQPLSLELQIMLTQNKPQSQDEPGREDGMLG